MYESTQKRGEYALSPTAWLPTDEHLLCQFPIFIRLHLTDVSSRPPPCRFEIGKSRLTREVMNVPTAVGFSEAVKKLDYWWFSPKCNVHFRLIMPDGCPWAHRHQNVGIGSAELQPTFLPLPSVSECWWYCLPHPSEAPSALLAPSDKVQAPWCRNLKSFVEIQWAAS